MAIHFRSIERRRTARAAMCMNVLAYGETSDGEKFKFWTRTTSVAGHGGVLELETPLRVGQVFELMNEYNMKRALAKIVFLRSAKKGQLMHAAFEFLQGGERFWSMSFPAANAKPLRRFLARPGAAN
jgi:hypothetical protein